MFSTQASRLATLLIGLAFVGTLALAPLAAAGGNTNGTCQAQNGYHDEKQHGKYGGFTKKRGSADTKKTSGKTDTNPCPRPPPCPDATAIAQADGSILVSWTAVAGADEYRVYRDNGAVFELVNSTTGLSYHDTNTTAGQTYTYLVLAVDNGLESEGCKQVSATAVPFFGGILGGALALLGSVGAFAYLRRRT